MQERNASPEAAQPPTSADSSALFAQLRRKSVLKLRTLWYLVTGWTLAYGLGSWLLEWTYSRIGARRPMAFLEGSKAAVYAAVWAPLLILAVWLTDRWPVRSVRDVRRIALHGAIALLAPFAWGTAAYIMCVAWVPGWQPWGVGRMYLNTTNAVLYVYTVVVVICHIVQRIRDHREREVAAVRAAEGVTQAQLQVLAMELQPHFLFNALHAVSSLMHSDREGARDAMRQLRAMLDYALQTATLTEVSLADELAQVRMYTQIQELRFGDRLCLEWRIAPEIERALVPHLLLQPLVENAIKYSVETLSGPRRVLVEASRIGNELSIRVADDGAGLENSSGIVKPRGIGRGLANARERLWHLYADRQSLMLRPGEGGQGVVADVRLPYHVQPTEQRAPSGNANAVGETSPTVIQ